MIKSLQAGTDTYTNLAYFVKSITIYWANYEADRIVIRYTRFYFCQAVSLF